MGCVWDWDTFGDTWRGGHPAHAGAVGLAVLMAMDTPGKGSKSGHQKGSPTKERSLVGDQARFPAGVGREMVSFLVILMVLEGLGPPVGSIHPV